MVHAHGGPLRSALLICLAIAGTACAGTLPEVGPTDIPLLQQRVATSPGDTDLQVQLGMAQFKAGDYEAARNTLRAAREAGNESGAMYLYLGMAEEELQDWDAAREAYNVYLDVGDSAPGRDEVRKRLTLIGRNLLRAQARQALAQEAEITATRNTVERSIAVLPMAFNSTNEELEPLIYALSDMMITDFKVSNALVVLERAQIQTLLDEMSLTSAGYAEEGTGARAGRLLRAEHVFQGVLTTLGDNDLQTDATVLNIPNTSEIGDLSESSVLEQLFDMEKQLVIRTIRDVLGVELTPAEEQAILENRMENVFAFLAYGRGLRELDRGNYDEAQAHFDEAFSLDPSAFGMMDFATLELGALIDARAVPTSDLATLAGSTGETQTGVLTPPPAGTTEDLLTIGIGGEAPIGAGSTPDGGQQLAPLARRATLTRAIEAVDPTMTLETLGLGVGDMIFNPTPGQSQPTTRDPIQEVAGQEVITSAATPQIRIVIRRPGGEE